MGGGSPGCAADGGRRTRMRRSWKWKWRRRAAAVKAEAMELARCSSVLATARGGEGLFFLPNPKRGSLPGCPRHDAAGTASSPPLAPARRRRSSSRRNTGHDEQQGDEIQLFYFAISMVSSSLTSDKVVG